MDELLGLLTGYTPVMIFIFLCFAVLMVMFYLVLRSLDDLTAGIREERNAVIDQMSGVKLQMEDLIRVQTEQRDILRAMLGPAEGCGLVFRAGFGVGFRAPGVRGSQGKGRGARGGGRSQAGGQGIRQRKHHQVHRGGLTPDFHLFLLPFQGGMVLCAISVHLFCCSGSGFSQRRMVGDALQGESLQGESNEFV